MKKKEIFSAQLYIQDGKPTVRIRNENQVTSLKVLLEFIDEFRIQREIISGKVVQRDDHTDYIYETKVDGKYDYLIVIKIKNSEKDLHYEAIKYFESLCDISVTIKKANKARIAAGLIAGVFILVNAGPYIVKGIENVIKSNIHHELTEEQQDEMNNIIHEGIYYPSEEEREDSEKWYYEYIENNQSLKNEITEKTM